ncbi:hypothetical protein EST38_g13870 [Candolleomyces aberdarensis]|uniref:F-box domain-containing protein n=1 Tax=Candolleomyces aberdarensis TaxID=2316362 RepID=A0A4Q2D157_9AGAR|nr:hypothetical protein EST38_g13870 [Candolleomyces aberdarensis]
MYNIELQQPARSGTGSARSAMQELPLDVCQEIISATLGRCIWKQPLWKLITLSHISSNFRHAALQSATLWADALDVSNPHPTAFDTVLSRARAAPLFLDGDLDVGKDPLVANRTKQLLNGDVGRMKRIAISFLQDTDLEPLWGALEKPTPLLREMVFGHYEDNDDVELRRCWPRKKLFEDDTSGRCELSFHNCVIPPTLVATHRLVELNLMNGQCCSSLTTDELCRWWSVCIDGASMPSLERLFVGDLMGVNRDSQGFLNSANPTPRLPPKLTFMLLGGDLESLVTLLENVQVPPSCSVTLASHMYKWINEDDALIETIIAMLSQVWKSRVSSPCSKLKLAIEDNFFIFVYESVIGWTLSFNCLWDFSPNRTNRLVKEILHWFHKLPLVFNPDGWLYLDTIRCCPTFSLDLHESYMELLKRFDSVRNLFLGTIEVSTDAMKFLQSPRVFSPSADSPSEESRLLFPNLRRVMLGEIWKFSEAHVNAFNYFAAEQDKLGAPIEVVEHPGGPPVEMPLTTQLRPQSKVQAEKEFKDNKKSEEEGGERDGEEEELEQERQDEEDDWLDE